MGRNMVETEQTGQNANNPNNLTDSDMDISGISGGGVTSSLGNVSNSLQVNQSDNVEQMNDLNTQEAKIMRNAVERVNREEREDRREEQDGNPREMGNHEANRADEVEADTQGLERATGGENNEAINNINTSEIREVTSADNQRDQSMLTNMSLNDVREDDVFLSELSPLRMIMEHIENNPEDYHEEDNKVEDSFDEQLEESYRQQQQQRDMFFAGYEKFAQACDEARSRGSHFLEAYARRHESNRFSQQTTNAARWISITGERQILTNERLTHEASDRGESSAAGAERAGSTTQRVRQEASFDMEGKV